MRKKIVLITGAAGEVGQALIKETLEVQEPPLGHSGFINAPE